MNEILNFLISNEVLIYLLLFTILLGFEVISKVPSVLHTPLMSGANAISGIVILGAIIFGGITILQLHAQGFDIRISAQYLSMLPYLATIIILVSLRMRAKNKTNRTMPNCLGRIFHSTT